MLGEGEDVAEEVDVVIGGEQGDQAEDQAAQGLEDPGAIKPNPGGVQIGQVWRKLRWVGVAGGWGEGAQRLPVFQCHHLSQHPWGRRCTGTAGERAGLLQRPTLWRDHPCAGQSPCPLIHCLYGLSR